MSSIPVLCQIHTQSCDLMLRTRLLTDWKEQDCKGWRGWCQWSTPQPRSSFWCSSPFRRWCFKRSALGGGTPAGLLHHNLNVMQPGQVPWDGHFRLVEGFHYFYLSTTDEQWIMAMALLLPAKVHHHPPSFRGGSPSSSPPNLSCHCWTNDDWTLMCTLQSKV